MKTHATLATALTLIALIGISPTAVHADAVTDWNAIMQSNVAPTNPFAQARSAAIVQLAVFEAVNAIDRDYQPYVGPINAPPGASPDAAAIAAAHVVLVALFPANAPSLDAAMTASLAAIPDGPAKSDGIVVGQVAAEILLALRATDGANAVVPYTPGINPGDWQPTPPAFAPALLPGWGAVDTFSIKDGAQFRLPPPPPLHSVSYARGFNEVREVGSATSIDRPQDRTDVAKFYIISAIQVYCPAARQVSAAQGKTLSENARDFALLTTAICDALISTFETKYYYNFWRPVTAIRAGDTDGNKRTGSDPAWLPLIATPPFPSYPSAHASAGGAARVVLESLYGEDGFSVTLTSPTAPGVVLHYTAWEQITNDVDDARIFGGIHFRFDQEAGARQGRHVGQYVLRRELRPVRRQHADGKDCAH